MLELVADERPFECASERVERALLAADRDRGSARLAISGGSAAQVIARLRDRLASDGVWARLALTWADERCVPFDDPDSNRGAAYRDGQLSEQQPVRVEVALWSDGETPERASDRVRAAWADQLAGGLDVALLGMGPDGHVASLFPGRAWDGEVVTRVHDSPKPPAERMTLTLAALNTATTVVVVATGEAKREAIRRLLAGDPALPASHLRSVTLVTDVTTGARR